jgi:hypothetical protein
MQPANPKAGDQTLAEVVQIDKHRRLAYNTKLVNALVRLGLWRFEPSEFMVLMYLLAHTLLVGKSRITVPLRVMLEGAYDNALERWVQVPIPLSKKTIIRAIKGLAASGYISVVRNTVVPGHGVLKAASTIVIGVDQLERFVAEAEATNGITIPYSDEGITPIVPDTEQSD